MKKLVLLVGLFSSCMCTDDERARKTLESSGFKDIDITGWSRGCADSDSTCTAFDAVGPTGKHVTGSVGCGRNVGCSQGKGCTIRID